MTTMQEVEAFKSHRLWTVAETVISLASNSAGRSTTDRYTLTRVLAVAKYLKSYRPIEPYLFPSNRISQAETLAASLDDIFSQLSGWDQEAAILPATVDALDNDCDQILSFIVDYKWPSARKGRSADAFAEAADAYRVVADRSLESIAESITTANTRLIALEAQAENLATESSTRNEEAAAVLQSIEATEKAQAENVQASLQSELKLVRESAQVQRDSLAKEAETLLAGLRENHETGNDLVRKVADQSVGGGYLSFAENEKKAYGRWSGVGISTAILAFGFLAVAFWSGQVSTVEASILKVGISLSLIGLSAYAFREAGKRQRQSLEARYRALDVLAMPPFSKDLSPAQQEQLRYVMGERLFGSTVESATKTAKNDGKFTSFNLSVDAATIRTIAETAKALKDTTTQ